MEEDRATGDDDGGIAGMMSSLTTSTTTATNNGVGTNLPVPASAPPVNPRKKTLSYSQPLGGGAPRRKNQTRNHSLGEDEYHFNSLNAESADGEDSNHPRYYHHSSSLPEDALRQHHSLPPPHLQHVQACPGAGSFFPLERISSSPAAVGGTDESQPNADPPTSAALPEFIGKGGGTGIFKVPLRGAVHPGRPPSIELRPHPLRETQVGAFLRTIACESSQLWAGQETGVRFWDLDCIFQGRDDNEKGPRGDEETAPFQESSRTSPALCLALDSATRLVWSGHKDGKIRSWRMDQPQQQELSTASLEGSGSTTAISRTNMKPGGAAATAASADASTIKEGLSWQAHRGPVLSLVFTSVGDLWSSSEAGMIKVWPWEAIEKSLSLSMEERHMAALLVERSYVDLRSQVTVNGICPLPSADIRFLLSDMSKAKVWSGTSQSFALWNVRTKELLKVFNIDGQTEIRVDIPSSHDSYVEDEMKVKFVSSSKKDKPQGSVSFFQRSRNALIGAADAVRRVATKGAFGEDNRKAEAMAISMDGMIWMGCANGSLIQWDANANRIQEFQHHSSSVQSLYAFGTRLWVGYASGNIQLLDLEGNLLGGWVAHSSPVIKMAVGGNYLFTLANSGGIRGWNLTSPGLVDDILRTELTSRELLYTKLENFKILVGTWNVGQERASHDALSSWVGSAAPEADIVIVGFQEVEMGAGFLAMAAAKETVGLEGSANGHWWLDAIGKTLDEGSTFERVGSRQLAGLLIGVWARKNLRKHIGDIDAAAVACGFGRAIGNKGGVGVRMRIYGRVICCVNCHLAAHLEAVNKRNADFDHIYRTMSFSKPSGGPHSVGGGATAVQVHRGPNPSGLHSDDGTPDLCEADMIIFLGDFNYRLHGISYDEARDFVSQRSFDWLREKDQLRAEMEAGKVFQGMREGLIRFPPTYKFERHKPGLSGYDSGEKKRIPAWCDRILYRDTRSISLQDCSLECPVVSSILQYNACMDVTDSDHKPVRCLLNVDVARVDKLVRRKEFGDIILSNERIKFFLDEACNVPEIIISANSIMLENSDTSIFHITNKSDKDKAVVEITCEGQSSVKEDGAVSEYHPRGASGFPCWLEVTPTVGVIKPGQNFEVSVHHEESHTLEDFVDGIPQNWWSEDTRDKEVILAVKVTGNFSAVSKTHKICVRHCFSSKNASGEQKGNSGRKLFRDFFSFTNSIEDSCNLHNA